MPCGCTTNQPSPPRLDRPLSDAQRGRVVVCASCSQGSRAGRCTVPRDDAGPDFGPLSGDCPLGKFASDGSVYWPTLYGVLPNTHSVRWMGAPFPLRVWFYLRHRRWPNVPGCGCIRRLKLLLTRHRPNDAV